MVVRNVMMVGLDEIVISWYQILLLTVRIMTVSPFFLKIFSINRKLEQCKKLIIKAYRNDLKFSDRYAWANSADPDQTSDCS